MQIIEKLREADIENLQIIRILTDLETAIYNNMADNLVEELTEEELQLIDELQPERLTSENALQPLGLTQKDVTIHLIHQLEDYLAALPQNLSEIKKHYLQVNQNK